MAVLSHEQQINTESDHKDLFCTTTAKTLLATSQKKKITITGKVRGMEEFEREIQKGKPEIKIELV